MTDLSDRTAPGLMLDLVVAAFRGRDPRLVALASEILTRSREWSVPCLTRIATDAKTSAALRVRALEVLARIGPPYGPEVLDLSVLVCARSRSVREAARGLFGTGAPADAVGSTRHR